MKDERENADKDGTEQDQDGADAHQDLHLLRREHGDTANGTSRWCMCGGSTITPEYTRAHAPSLSLSLSMAVRWHAHSKGGDKRDEKTKCIISFLLSVISRWRRATFVKGITFVELLRYLNVCFLFSFFFFCRAFFFILVEQATCPYISIINIFRRGCKYA